jgi:hypothetical protein
MSPTVILPSIGAAFLLVAAAIAWGTPFFWLLVAESGGIAAVGLLAIRRWRG